MARRRRPNAIIATGEILVWLLFFALLLPAGVTGWAIGHYTGHNTRTVTVAAGTQATTAPATTTAATTAAATTQQTTTAAATQQTTTSAAPASAAKGKAIFTANGCGACHTFKPAGSTATVGPDLDTKLAADAKKAKMSLAAFTLESIVKPNAYISPGFPKGTMPQNFGQVLSKAQLATLVSFVTGGK
jgi:cytochrome c551/c552